MELQYKIFICRNLFFLKFCLSFMIHRSLDTQTLWESVPGVWEDYWKNKQVTFLYLQYKKILLGEFLSWVLFFHWSYFLSLFCFFLSFRTIDSTVSRASGILKLPFISWDRDMDILSHLGEYPGKTLYKMLGNWAMTVKEWGPVISHGSIQKDDYLLNILLIYYCGSMEKKKKRKREK